ncbi:MAG: hypothetical protein QUT30_11125 [Acidobacteriota bacterium]|nr:hypothetical protein [Acidobacteriota bacterium]
MRTKNETERFMTEEEERRLGEGLRKYLLSSHPNPDRNGCPDQKLLRDLAFHKKLGNPQLFEQVTVHMSECSECVRDALRYAEEYKQQRRSRHQARMAMAIAASVLLAVALWVILRLHPKPEITEKSPEAPVQMPVNPDMASAGAQKSIQPGMAPFTPLTIELPLRWRAANKPEAPITLPRSRLQLDVRLPVGSSDGAYKCRITDKSGKVLKTAEGIAQTVNGITTLKFQLDTSDMPQGNYRLSILEPGFDEWSDYVIALK